MLKGCVPTSAADGVGCNGRVTQRESAGHRKQCRLVYTEFVIEAKLQAHNKKEDRKRKRFNSHKKTFRERKK